MGWSDLDYSTKRFGHKIACKAIGLRGGFSLSFALVLALCYTNGVRWRVDMRRVSFRSLIYYQFDSLASRPELAHGVFTRLGGHSRPPWDTLNTGHTVGDDPEAVEENHRLVCSALGFTVDDLASPYQVHGSTVGVVDECDRGRVRPQTDALVTASPGVLLMLRFADCVQVFFYAPRHRAVGLAHAGWRGTVAGIARATVEVMREAFGTRPADLIAGIGPAIGPCCYRIGSDVVEAVRDALPDAPHVIRESPGHTYLDLWESNRHQLVQAGVRQIEVAAICTSCNTEEWFSHRAEHGRTGRFGALIGLRR